MTQKSPSTTSRILHNSFWFGIESLLETAAFLGTSIAVARYLGPAKLGYFSYINFFVSIVTRTSGNGLATATRKYMSEFLALDQPGTARAVYNLAYRYQLLGTVGLTMLGVGGVVLFGDPSIRVMSCILILSIIPGVMSWVPAQANNAFEDLSKNTLSAFAYIVTYVAVIVLTLHFQWDLVGVASATLVARTVEVLLRTIPLHRKLRTMPLDALPRELKLRIRNFCVEAIGIQLLMAVVWDRSEMIFLRAFASIEQIAFYSVSFGLAGNLLMLPRIFGGATGVTLMVESSRDPGRVDSIVKNACRYLLLVVFPVHLGAAAITSQAVQFAYGAKYAAAVPVLIVASILAIPRAFQEIPEILMRAADRQRTLLLWLCVTGALNIGLDALLIPRYGAVGAAWANGLAQGFGVVSVWQQARRAYRFSFPVRAALRFLCAGGIMAVLAFVVGRVIPGLAGLIVAVLTAVPSYIFLIKLLHCLDAADGARLTPIGNRLPGPLRRAYVATIAFATADAEAGEVHP